MIQVNVFNERTTRCVLDCSEFINGSDNVGIHIVMISSTTWRAWEEIEGCDDVENVADSNLEAWMKKTLSEVANFATLA
jgi:hypothetical protein